MFPWSPEFVWDTAHILFFGSFYAVVLVVGGMLATAALRARRGRERAAAVAWHADFEELPPAARACRHQLTGEAPGRTCDNGFDCRKCVAHPTFLAQRFASSGAGTASGTGGSCSANVHEGGDEPHEGAAEALGVSMPLDRYYHRGHTWVRPEADGTLTFGLDAVARRLVGAPERVDLPPAGARLTVNGIGCRMRVAGSEVRVLSPVEGEVLGACGEGADFTLSVRPADMTDLRHLLAGDEVRAWLVRETERLELVLGLRGVGRALADGGELVSDLPRVLPRAQVDSVLGEMFLDA